MLRKSTLFLFPLVLSLTSVSFASNPSELSTGINTLGHRVLNQIHKNAKDENLFISSFSIHAALSMAQTGAGGVTEKELATLLGLPAGMDAQALADAWNALRLDLQNADPKVKFDIANSMWGNADLKVKFTPHFIRLNQFAHEAEIRSEKFSGAAFLGDINGWVNTKTNGKIPSILSGPIPKDQLFYLVNAIYFKGAWDVAFDENDTVEDNFYVTSAKVERANYMFRSDSFAHYADKSVLEAVKIPFGKANRMSMAIYMPYANTPQGKVWLNNIDAKNLGRVMWNYSPGSVQIPRFKIEYKNDDVVNVLKALGVKIAFSNSADFSGIAEGEKAKINKIIHKAVIEVTEEGAEAAAATVVGGARTVSAQPEMPFRFKAERPFYFEIRDNATDVVLFSGIVRHPVDPK
jgi:serine protease inhibitor